MDSQGEDRIPVPGVDAEICTGCGICVQVCPNRVWAIAGGKAFVAHPFACIYYGACEAACPPRAITRPFLIIPADQEDSGTGC